MRSTAIFIASSIFISSALSAVLVPRAASTPRRDVVKSLSLIFPSSQDGDTNVTLSFTVHDKGEANGSGKGSAKCSGSWTAGSHDWPQEGTAAQCQGKNDFEWYLDSTAFLGGNENFTLFVNHGFENTAVGPLGNDYETTFAKNWFATPQNLTCAPNAANQYECDLNPGTKGILPVYAETA